MFDNIFILRYMGNKNKLLDFIVPEIHNVTEEGDTICDIMGGTNVIGYALKRRNRIISNDIQAYSYVIGKALLENNREDINSRVAKEELESLYFENMNNGYYDYFTRNYTDTYFSGTQCQSIDSIRYAIEGISNESRKALYLCALMNVMCKVQSTPGHFAQFMPKNHPRIIPLRQMKVWELFIEKCDDFRNIVKNNYDNKSFNLDYKELFKNDIMSQVKCFYLDSPYSGEQYSRFYHILETVVKYDSPTLSHKALYRQDRFKSRFCYKGEVKGEFEYIIQFVSSKNSKLVISYSNKGLMTIEEIEELGRKYFSQVKCLDINYLHSTQGKGSNQIKEYIIIMQ